MKRSHAIALGATGIIAAGAWLGSGTTRVGDDTPTVEAGIYADANECISARVLTREVCEAEFDKAAATHTASAPKFADRATCETQYGANQCKSSTFNGASVFVPAMIGMLVANHLSNQRQSQPLYPNRNALPPCAPGQGPQTQQPGTPQMMPTCAPASSSSGSTSSSRSYSTASGYLVGRSMGAFASNAMQIPAAIAAAPAARSSVIPAGTPRSAPTSIPASSGTVARGGFGSTGRASSSSS